MGVQPNEWICALISVGNEFDQIKAKRDEIDLKLWIMVPNMRHWTWYHFSLDYISIIFRHSDFLS